MDIDEGFLPRDVLDGLERARHRHRLATGGKLRIQVGEAWYPIRSYSSTGFDVPLDVAPKLRGRVEIHDGPRMICTALIVAAMPDGDLMRYEYKRTTPARMTAPLDYERAGDLPSGYLSA